MIDATPETEIEAGGITAGYFETDEERVLAFERRDGPEDRPAGGAVDGGRRTAAVAQNRDGYAMLKVRPTADGDELERYYGFDMALDHCADLLGVGVGELPIPEAAEDMGM
jgi:DnaJ-domain-containing protein 1